MSKLYMLKAIQNIPAGIDTVWDFISSPKNLKTITPPYMGFEITSEENMGKMYPGQIIAYEVSPILSIKMDWVTEITHVKDKEYFVDEQRFGPYSLWHHKHFIKPIGNGTEMTDIVHYKLPMGFLGDLANSILVRKQLNEIFDFRFHKLEELFGKYSG
jgi:ligand-binding SRPBCC domain-containing protein